MNGKFTGYVWNGSSLAAETSGNAVTSTYTYGVDGITTANINGTTNIYLKNIHGDVVGTTDANGTLQKSYRYDAFGNEQNPDEADKNPFRYTGEYFDKETDNIYLRNRYYAPNLGRFLNEDTHWNTSNMIYGDREYKDGEIKIPDIHAIMQSRNLYIYCRNSPVMYMDWTGESVSGYGVVASMSAILGIEGQYLWVTDEKGGFALVAVGGVINSVGVGIGGLTVSFPTMPTVKEMEGYGFSLNGSIGSGGAGIVYSGPYQGFAYQYTLGAEVDYWLGADGTYTHILFSGNIYEIGNWLKNALNTILPDNLKIK